jgi:hypothetical protein
MPRTVNEFQRNWYDQESTQQAEELQSLAGLMIEGRLTRSKFEDAFLDSLRQYYIRLALVAKGGRSLTSRDRSDIGKFLSIQKNKHLSKFATDLEEFRLSGSKVVRSAGQALGRSASYANAWGVWSRFALPSVLADALPALPGIDCLGGMRCGCWLEWDYDPGWGVDVFWHVNPFKETCILCAGFDADWSPYHVPLEDLDPTLLNEEMGFLAG